MTPDEIETKARALLDRRTGSYEHAPEIAETILALLPVVKAAEQWRDCYSPHAETCSDARCVLAHAIDTMRSQLRKDGAR